MVSLSEWIVPGYTELKQLGSGGFGSVVLARHDATGTPVAVKYLKAELRQDPDFAVMFRAEAESLGALDDPHVVRLYEYVESPSGAAIVMELIDGVTLGNMLAQHGKTTPEAALVVLYGSLLGLAAAHARGVVHRDFKPANVLVNAHGASKLTDFGIAARAGTPTVPSGSVAYAPPEQFDGGPASPAADVYAATATFYECLAGRPPFTGATLESVIWQHHSADVPMDPVPEPLRPIVARGLAKDPTYRPSDAAALAAALRTAATTAYGPGWEDRGRSQLGAAAVLLAALWPSAGAGALHVASAEQVNLSQGAQHAQAAHQSQAAHQVSRSQLHRWHVRHLLHLRHLAAIAATTAVVAAGVTVVVTSRAPSGPGTAAQPAVAAYAAPLTAAIPVLPVSLSSTVDPAGDAYVTDTPGAPLTSSAKLEGAVTNPAAGEVAEVYAQQFPYTSAPVLVQSAPLTPSGAFGEYDFTVTPLVATRYQVKLRLGGSATPVAASAVKTVYVLDSFQYSLPTAASAAACSGNASCPVSFEVTVHTAPSAILTDMAERKYLYYGDMAPHGTEALNATLLLDPDGTTSAPVRTAANTYTMTVTYHAAVGGYVDGAVLAFCTMPTEAQDGIGLPGPSPCGAASIPALDTYFFG
jgi:eukaryotic-like serine/threonine-protein kinase